MKKEKLLLIMVMTLSVCSAAYSAEFSDFTYNCKLVKNGRAIIELRNDNFYVTFVDNRKNPARMHYGKADILNNRDPVYNKYLKNIDQNKPVVLIHQYGNEVWIKGDSDDDWMDHGEWCKSAEG
ncbi:hypothetical protein QVN42_17045 [Yersinia nurmii]|uniref:Uncharacterized protein n=1 Tax=Yersinia nurmii TaxID=685706 RepID=A0AAW7KAF9_9GAMM|nr:hypothetical protein [Yersinia nurmii]MDN0089060.1 hypothetical protein [Yersinia nurmii]